MPVTLQWSEIFLRLGCTIVAGTLIGLNRTEHGRPAGLRTTLLVCLAASISMIQANLLMNSVGKAHDSFIVLDLMRLPLGILTGVGFIGAGAILRRDNRVLGLTTAATLWFVTVMGLCFGGGQIELGTAALVVGLAVLWGFKLLERQIPQDRQASLELTLQGEDTSDDDVRKRIEIGSFKIVSLGIERDKVELKNVLTCEVKWRARTDDFQKPAFLDDLTRLPGVSKLKWSPEDAPAGL